MTSWPTLEIPRDEARRNSRTPRAASAATASLSLTFVTLAGGVLAGAGRMPRSLGAAAAPMQQRYRGRDIYVGDADLNAF